MVETVEDGKRPALGRTRVVGVPNGCRRDGNRFHFRRCGNDVDYAIPAESTHRELDDPQVIVRDRPGQRAGPGRHPIDPTRSGGRGNNDLPPCRTDTHRRQALRSRHRRRIHPRGRKGQGNPK